MLQIRVEGDPAEARALLDRLAGGGIEVQVGTTKDRGGFAHVYAVLRMPDWPAAPAAGPVRVPAVVGRPIERRRGRR
ncbi:MULTISPECIES: hypothetical protein [Micromonospora]|uniref:hypothetical protein n=1 Tax=Micromonospora TaxID=1873 RepID=UPI00064B985B|nr:MULTISPECIES: hypothetical protein [unclassified Micromonospora]MDG4756120.1 hypothetical protein [Micromonospora sp. WMMD718]